MREWTIPATKEAVAAVMHSLERELEASECSEKKRRQLNIALEELMVNIVNYAYGEEHGIIRISYEFWKTEGGVCLKLICADHGKSYNPLKKKEPDVSLPAEKRKAGGLGIFMMKKLVDSIEYERVGGENQITIIKQMN